MRKWLPFCLVLGLLIAFRTIGSLYPTALPNFQPLAALFFCGSLMAIGWRGFAIPLAVWAVTYPLPALFQGNAGFLRPEAFVTSLAAFALVFALGKRLAHRGFALALAGSLASAVLFHLITNGLAWLGDPRYATTLGGLWQSLWTGAPGDVLPSWVFLRNLSAANLIFTGLFLVSRQALPATRGESRIPQALR